MSTDDPLAPFRRASAPPPARPARRAPASSQRVRWVVESALKLVTPRNGPGGLVGVPAHGAPEVVPLDASGQERLGAMIYRATGTMPSAQHLQEATAILRADYADAPTVEVGGRLVGSLSEQMIGVAHAGGATVIRPGHAANVPHLPLPYRRHPGLRPAPEPDLPGSLDGLFDGPLSAIPPTRRDLVHAVLLSLFVPDVASVGLRIEGVQGAGKSSVTKALVAIADPAEADAVAMPDNEADLNLLSSQRSLIAFDNLDGLTAATSNAICRLITGAASSKRRLYTDSDVVATRSRSAVIVNGISIGGLRPDAVERLTPIHLVRPAVFRTDRALSAELKEMLPRVLGALFTELARVMQLDFDALEAELGPTLARMADSDLWFAACDRALGLNSRSQYAAAQRQGLFDSSEGDPIITAVARFMASRPDDEWQGSASVLLGRLDRPSFDDFWPRTPRALSAALSRCSVALRELYGIAVGRARSGDARVILLSRLRHEGDAVCVTAEGGPW